jgi:hypothetical protein
VRHVGLPVFAVILCRKFATAAVFSWHFSLHLPHHKNAAALNRRELRNCRKMIGASAMR